MLQYALLALSAVDAINSISQGYSERKEAEYNAGLLNEKASMIGIKQNMEFAAYERLKGEMYGTSMANIAQMGIKPTGSALAVVLNAQHQITVDQIIAKFNTEQEKRYTEAEAQAQIRAGDRAVKQGYARAFSSLLKSAGSYASYTNGASIGKKGI